MDNFLQRFGGRIKGAITGFDRIVSKGCNLTVMLKSVNFRMHPHPSLGRQHA